MPRAKASHCLRRISQGEPRDPLPLRHAEWNKNPQITQIAQIFSSSASSAKSADKTSRLHCAPSAFIRFRRSGFREKAAI
jgi:hypothetical protein